MLDDEPTAVHSARCAVWSSDEPCDCNAWRDLAACSAMDPADADRIFFPTTGKGRNPTAAIAEARRVCLSCPVRRDCSSYADHVETGERGRVNHMAGIFGGETVKARVARRKGDA